MTNIICPADCLFAVEGKCLNNEIKLSYHDYGHMMCEMQLERKISGVEKGFGYQPKDITEIYPKLTSTELLVIVNNWTLYKITKDQHNYINEVIKELRKECR